MRPAMRRLARWLDLVSRGKATPDMVTLAGVAIQVPAAWFIAVGWYIPAAVILIVSVMFDFLDGELARLQKRASVRGMLLDATTDRIGETIVFCGIVYRLAQHGSPAETTWAVAACGAAQCVSYVKAKGEMAVAIKDTDHNSLNRRFQLGPGSLSERAAVLIIGLLTGYLFVAVLVVLVLSLITIGRRWLAITRSLSAL